MNEDLQSEHKRFTRNLLSVERSASPPGLAEFRLSRSQQTLRTLIHRLNTLSPQTAAQLAAFLFLRPRRKPLKYTDHLPEGAHRIAIYYDLCRLTAYSWGTGDKTIVLVHGWESHIGRMLPLVTPLVEAGFRVVALDSPGHGQSPRLLTNMYEVGEAVRSTLEQIAPVYAIVANSFGAAATVTMLARHQDLQPPHIVLLSPMAHLEQHIDVFKRLLGIDDQLVDRVRSIIQHRMPLPIAEFNVARAITSISSLGLIIHDVDDPVIPFHSVEPIAENWNQAQLISTTGLGHKHLITNADVQAAIVEYLVCGEHTAVTADVIANKTPSFS